MKNQSIKCPSCGEEINIENALFHKVEEQLKSEYQIKLNSKTDELNKQRQDLAVERAQFELTINRMLKERLSLEKATIEKNVRDELTEQISAYKEELGQKSSQLVEFNRTKAELERVKREKEELRGQVLAESEQKISDLLREQKTIIQNEIEAKNHMKLLEKEHLINGLSEKLQDAQRKIEQGSMQVQGEVQEIAIEELLKINFPLDTVDEVKKGARGADCLLTINGRAKRAAGTIYFESKRTKEFQASWLEKFAEDMMAKGATCGVLVTEALPKGIDGITQINSIWVCSFADLKIMIHILRESIIQLDELVRTQQNKGGKMDLLYSYLTGKEFKTHVESIVSGFVTMKSDLEAERRAIETIWKKRDKQLEKVLINTTHMYSTIQGISDNAIENIPLLQLEPVNQ